MKAHKIILDDYEIELSAGGDEKVKRPYDVKRSLVSILLGKEQQHSAITARQANKLAERIEESNGEILMDSSEYRQLVDALNKIRGITRNDIPLVDRIFDAPEVEVAEAKP